MPNNDHTQGTLFVSDDYTHPVFTDPGVGEYPHWAENYLRILSRSLIPLDGRPNYDRVLNWAYAAHQVCVTPEYNRELMWWLGMVTHIRHRHTGQLDLLTKTHTAQEKPHRRANWVSQREWIKRVHESCVEAALCGSRI